MSEKVNIKQASEMIGVKPGTLRAAIRCKRLDAARVPGGVYEIEVADLEHYMATKRGRGRPKSKP